MIPRKDHALPYMMDKSHTPDTLFVVAEADFRFYYHDRQDEFHIDAVARWHVMRTRGPTRWPRGESEAREAAAAASAARDMPSESSDGQQRRLLKSKGAKRSIDEQYESSEDDGRDETMFTLPTSAERKAHTEVTDEEILDIEA